MTKRSMISLLDYDYIFSQRKLLAPREFAKAFEHRGLKLSDLTFGEDFLDEFHRAKVLIPLYRLEKDLQAARAANRRNDQQALNSATYGQHLHWDGPSLRWYRDHGYLHDPRSEPHRPRRAYTSRLKGLAGHHFRTSEYAYSQYQLLLVPSVRNVVTKVRHGKIKNYVLPLRIVASDLQLEHWRLKSLESEELVRALSILETRYLPRVTGRLTNHGWGDLDDVETYGDNLNPVTILKWLEWPTERLYDTAERLLMTAHSIDPLGKWHRLIAMGRAEFSGDLRGDALVANDHRVAAEMLLQFYEELVEAGAAPKIEAPPGRFWHPLRERLTASGDLDETLTDFGLSPHPSLVLALEGTTEMYIIPRVMDLLGIPRRRDFIVLVDSGGENRDLGPLAAYASAPGLGGSVDSDGITLSRPVTKFMVAFDGDRTFREADARERKRSEWVRRIHSAVKQLYGEDVSYETLDGQVFFETWDEHGHCFEFAHFTDSEILEAIRRTYAHDEQGSSRPWGEHLATLAQMRANRGKLKDYLGKWHGSKAEVAVELWPVLEEKLRAADSRAAADQIPVARVLLRAAELAYTTLRHSGMILRTQPAPPA